MKKNRTVFTIVITLFFCLTSVGCKNNGKSAMYDYFSFSDKAFSAELEGEINKVNFIAKITCQAPVGYSSGISSDSMSNNPSNNSSEKKRGIKLEFFSPDGLCGVVAKRDESGKISVALNSPDSELIIEDSPVSGLFDIAELLLMNGEIISVTSADSVCSIKVSNNTAEAVFGFDEKTGMPLKVQGNFEDSEIRITVNWIQFE